MSFKHTYRELMTQTALPAGELNAAKVKTNTESAQITKYFSILLRDIFHRSCNKHSTEIIILCQRTISVHKSTQSRQYVTLRGFHLRQSQRNNLRARDSMWALLRPEPMISQKRFRCLRNHSDSKYVYSYSFTSCKQNHI
jgi:hypothetical protein